MTKVELDLANSTHNKEKETFDKMVASYEQAKQSMETQTRRLSELKTKISSTEKYMKETAAELTEVTEAEGSLDSKLQMLNAKMRERSSQIASQRSQSAQLKALMDQKSSGRIPGIVGRLGDLGAIDDKYDIAIRTACGPLDNIVVDTLKTG